MEDAVDGYLLGGISQFGSQGERRNDSRSDCGVSAREADSGTGSGLCGAARACRRARGRHRAVRLSPRSMPPSPRRPRISPPSRRPSLRRLRSPSPGSTRSRRACRAGHPHRPTSRPRSMRPCRPHSTLRALFRSNSRPPDPLKMQYHRRYHPPRRPIRPSPRRRRCPCCHRLRPSRRTTSLLQPPLLPMPLLHRIRPSSRPRRSSRCPRPRLPRTTRRPPRSPCPRHPERSIRMGMPVVSIVRTKSPSHQVRVRRQFRPTWRHRHRLRHRLQHRLPGSGTGTGTVRTGRSEAARSCLRNSRPPV